MKQNRIKLFTIIFFTIFAIGTCVLSFQPISTTVNADTTEETYKTKCAMCHSPKAEKAFNPEEKDDVLVDIVLKGKKTEKPPAMPGFETKGMKPDEAKALVAYMKKLRSSPEKPSEAKVKATELTREKSREFVMEMYSANCATCHSANAEKLYDPKKTLDEQTQTILKGKKGEKPPFMPGYETKGYTEKQAKALAAYMLELRTPNN